jgi:hypothetical protein
MIGIPEGKEKIIHVYWNTEPVVLIAFHGIECRLDKICTHFGKLFS